MVHEATDAPEWWADSDLPTEEHGVVRRSCCARRARDRVLWPDLAKGICILLVVLHHTTTKHYVDLVPPGAAGIANGWADVSHFLKPVRMPLFFVISGLFAASALARPWRQVARRAVAPYYLYVVWLLVLGAVFAVERTLPMNRTQDLAELAWDLVLASTGLWFLYALAVYFVLAKLLLPLPAAWVVLPAAALTASASALPFDEVNRVSVLVHFATSCSAAAARTWSGRLARTPRRCSCPPLAWRTSSWPGCWRWPALRPGSASCCSAWSASRRRWSPR